MNRTLFALLALAATGAAQAQAPAAVVQSRASASASCVGNACFSVSCVNGKCATAPAAAPPLNLQSRNQCGMFNGTTDPMCGDAVDRATLRAIGAGPNPYSLSSESPGFNPAPRNSMFGGKQ